MYYCIFTKYAPHIIVGTMIRKCAKFHNCIFNIKEAQLIKHQHFCWFENEIFRDLSRADTWPLTQKVHTVPLY